MNKVKSFHIEWNNHLRERSRYSWEPIVLVSDGKTVSWEFVLEDGTIIKGKKEELND